MRRSRLFSRRTALPAAVRGLSMIESMIAILVLSFGILSVLGLQVTGVQATRESYVRSQAVQRVYDMADRMRTNLIGLNNGDFDRLSGSASAAVDCSQTACSTADTAAYDFAQWNQANGLLLPQGQGVVCRNDGATTGVAPDGSGCSGTGSSFTIKVWWFEGDRQSAASTTLSHAIVFTP